MGSGSNPVGEYECIDVRWSDPDGVERADVSQFTERAEPVHRLGAYVEVYSDLVDRQQRPQPVRRILGERCQNPRSFGIRARVIPSRCERLRNSATPCKRLIRPSKPRAAGSTPSRRMIRETIRHAPRASAMHRPPHCPRTAPTYRLQTVSKTGAHLRVLARISEEVERGLNLPIRGAKRRIGVRRRLVTHVQQFRVRFPCATATTLLIYLPFCSDAVPLSPISPGRRTRATGSRSPWPLGSGACNAA